MSDSDNGEKAQLNVPASSAPAVEKKAARARAKKVKQGLAGPNLVGKKATLEGAIEDNVDPSCPFFVRGKLDFEELVMWDRLIREYRRKSMKNDIITSDPTSKWLHDNFVSLMPRLKTIMEKDSVSCFLSLFNTWEGRTGMVWHNFIASETLTYMVKYDALRCAKVVLEGKEPGLRFFRANPNCINPYGYFPLHEAAENFSVDMIKLLFRHGASANVWTVGEKVIEDLLPLHVAVENACMHKYLEDNLLPSQDPLDYTFNLIHLLCLPEMKIFMDTIMLLAKETDNLVDELWNYITGRKPRQTAILLLAAHEQIRGVSSSKRNVKGKQNEFPVIMNRIMEQLSSTNTNGENGNTEEMVEERMKLCEMFRLVHIISEAGEDLKKYIQAHSEATHAEVLEHVSTILKDHGFCPTGGIDVRNLHPYACKTFGTKLYDKGHVDVAKEVLEMIRGTSEKAVREKPMQGWDPDYSRRMFFPYWRSVLNAKCRVKMYPYYAPLPLPKLDVKEHWNPQSNSTAAGSSQEPNHNLGWLGRQQLKSNQQPIRTFSTASFAVLKKALRK